MLVQNTYLANYTKPNAQQQDKYLNFVNITIFPNLLVDPNMEKTATLQVIVNRSH